MLSHRNAADMKGRKGDWIGPAPWIHAAPPGPVTLKALRSEPHLAAICGDWPCPLIVRRAQGIIVEDVDQNRYLDFDAAARVSVAGHAHPAVLKAMVDWASGAISPQTQAPATMPHISLIRQLLRISRGDQSRQVWLTAFEEAALELAAEAACRHTGRRRILELGPEGLRSGRHVSWSGAASRCRVIRIACPQPADIASLDAAAGADPPAAVQIRPLSVAADHWLPPDDLLPALQQWCRQKGALLIVDESESGLGRTGRMFWSDGCEVVPDALVVADGPTGPAPFAAVIAAQPLAETLVALSHGRCAITPPAAAAAAATLELAERQFMPRAAELGPAAMNKLQGIVSRHRNLRRPRGLGLTLAVDVVRAGKRGMPDPALRDRLLAEAFSRGLLLRGCGRCAIRFSPALTVNQLQMDIALEIFDEAVATVAG